MSIRDFFRPRGERFGAGMGGDISGNLDKRNIVLSRETIGHFHSLIDASQTTSPEEKKKAVFMLDALASRGVASQEDVRAFQEQLIRIGITEKFEGEFSKAA